MDKANYTKCFGALLPHLKRLAIYDKFIADGANGVIRAKAKAIHHARITDWDAFEAADRKHKALS